MDERMKLLTGPLEQKEVEVSDLPDLDLYMDQIITLFAEKTGGREGLLTKTMINNYSKEGLIKPVKGKKYTKEHILQMLLIWRLKQTLSIQQIKGVMDRVGADAQKSQSPEKVWEDLYRDALESREKDSELLSGALKELLNRHPGDSCRDSARLLLELSWISHMTKRMCDVLVEESFPCGEKEKKKEKNKDREK